MIVKFSWLAAALQNRKFLQMHYMLHAHIGGGTDLPLLYSEGGGAENTEPLRELVSWPKGVRCKHRITCRVDERDRRRSLRLCNLRAARGTTGLPSGKAPGDSSENH